MKDIGFIIMVIGALTFMVVLGFAVGEYKYDIVKKDCLQYGLFMLDDVQYSCKEVGS